MDAEGRSRPDRIAGPTAKAAATRGDGGVALAVALAVVVARRRVCRSRDPLMGAGGVCVCVCSPGAGFFAAREDKVALGFRARTTAESACYLRGYTRESIQRTHTSSN